MYWKAGVVLVLWAVVAFEARAQTNPWVPYPMPSNVNYPVPVVRFAAGYQ